MATTWELSFQKVKEASPAAADLLNLCAFLAPDDIPKELLEQGAEHLPEALAAGGPGPPGPERRPGGPAALLLHGGER